MVPDAPPEDRRRRAHRKLSTFLQEKGLRATRQRERILDAFMEEAAHVSVEELSTRLHRDHPSIGHATIYRSMNLFVEAGIAKERRFHEGRVRYEPSIDVPHHDHLICLQCGEIEEFEDPTIERIQGEIARRRGFRVEYHRLELYGRCTRCNGQTQSASEA